MSPQPTKIQKFFKAILVAEVIYLGASFFIPQLPGWKMFARFEHLEFKLFDGDGKEINYQPYLPAVNYQLSLSTALKLSKFICAKKTDPKITLVISDKEKYLFQGPGCDFQKI